MIIQKKVSNISNNNTVSEEIFNYYNNKLNNYNLVFRHIKLYWYSFILTGLISAILLIDKTFFRFQERYLFKGITVLSVLFYFFLFFWVNKKSKDIVQEKYEIKKSKKIFSFLQHWSEGGFHKLKINKLEDELTNINPAFSNNPEKIDLLIEIMNDDAKKIKNSGEIRKLFLPGLALGIIIPVWTSIVNQFFKILYRSVNEASLYHFTLEVLKNCGLFCIPIFFIFLMVGVFNYIGKEVLDRNYKKRKRLIFMLKNIKLNSN